MTTTNNACKLQLTWSLNNGKTAIFIYSRYTCTLFIYGLYYYTLTFIYFSDKIVRSSLEKTTGDEKLAYSLSILHAHCEACYRSDCNIKSDNLSSCEMTTCPMNCGQKLHTCKLQDHQHICERERIPCVNQEYGCPVELTRMRLASHICKCPASVVRCVIEWNRWPMHSIEDKVKAGLPLNDPRVKCGQLDVALALRDQRILMESMKAPKSMRQVFQNSLTKKYPSVPFVSHSNSFDSDTTSGAVTSDDETDAPWESSTLPPGLKSSIYSKLYKASKETSDSLSAALNIVCSRCSTHHLSGISENGEGEATLFFANKKYEHKEEQMINNQTKETDCLCTNEITPDCEIEQVLDEKCEKKDLTKENGTDEFNQTLADGNTSSTGKELNEFYKQNIKLHELLGVSLGIEVYSKYIPKPMKMYTFLCAQDFRREEYTWHFKNVHNDIHCGLSGFLEQRCPLSYRGCTFSFQNIVPNQPSGNIVHSSLLASFGLITSDDMSFEEIPANEQNCFDSPEYISSFPDTEEAKRKLREATPEIVTSHKYDSLIKVFPRHRKVSSQQTNKDSPLMCLPFEVLQCIISYLDSFSLCNVSLTCKTLREVCCSLLVEKGMVVLVWEKEKRRSKTHWKVSKQVFLKAIVATEHIYG